MMADEQPRKTTVVGEDDRESVVTPGTQGPGIIGQVNIPDELPVLPLRNMVIYPSSMTVMPLDVGRPKSRRMLEAILPRQRLVAAVCQRQAEVEDPKPEDLYEVGTACAILKLLRRPDGIQTIIIQGLSRIRLKRFTAQEPFLSAQIETVQDVVSPTPQTEAQIVTTRHLAQRVVELSPNVPDEATVILGSIEQPGQLADFLASNLQMEIAAKQALLEELDVVKRLQTINVELQRQLEVLELSNKIQTQVRSNIDKSQREYYLQEQLKAIQKELGQTDEKSEEIRRLRERIGQTGMPDPVKAEALRELDRLERIPSVSPEYNVLWTYMDYMIELPWSKLSEDRLDVNLASRVLDKDHYDLEKVKRRILEYLAVRKLAPESRGPILCLVGPPGVGKTSLGQSVARALGRKFIHMSLGGMRDEAELRGHRRTYIGAMPGRVIQEIRKAGTRNPVFMLDEVDKVGADFRGDPTSALLEVLDPAQNSTFQDHYLNVPFDLSRVLFIATANYMAPVPPALRDRMEVIELPGYTQREKLHIARKYLVPRQLKENGLREDQAKWNAAAIKLIIASYTREAGVRELERQIGTVSRGIAAMIARGQAKSRSVTGELIEEMLGPRRFESELAQRTSVPGVATGLAFTPTGGEIIFVEAASYPGRGNLTLTGQIGDVMRESAQTALSLLKSRADELGVKGVDWSKTDIHVHVPAGAVPKDGPSAGVAMFTALTSLVRGKAVRPDVAMTGEITLRGLVLPVGGIKEKMLAARQAGIRKVVLPERNRKDLVDLPEEVRKTLDFCFVERADQVLEQAIQDESAKAGPKAKAPPNRGTRKH
jgi:ATP-dependent Lon protease